MKRSLLACLAVWVWLAGNSQELYVFSEPASNMPAHSLTVKLAAMSAQEESGRRSQRYTPELMFGFSKKFMMHVGTTISNMHTPYTRWESVFLYGKYRFLSVDDVHRHFRMAVFTEATLSRNRYHYEDVSIQGDRSGLQAGLIATQLLNRLAVSATLSHTQALDPSRFNKVVYQPKRVYQSLNYSLSAGYLILPKEYKNYKQLNMNVYAELLGQQTLDRKSFYVDLAPALQFIFNSNTKLNLGYRFRLNGNQPGTIQNSYVASLEHTFFNALKRNKN